MHHVFLYGTLKRGFANHDPERLGRFYVGAARSVERYPLCVAGRWFSPVVFPEPGTGKRFAGELYRVDADTLAWLDELEHVGRETGYSRRLVELECEAGRRIEAWCYMKERAIAQPVHGEGLDDYRDPRYVPRSMRS